VSAVPLDVLLQKLSDIAPLRFAEPWDNVGLLVGDRQSSIASVMTCLTITPEVVAEAVQKRVGFIIAHHPLPFKPLSRINSDSTAGRMLLALIAGGVAVYSAHTAFDSAPNGINAMWADKLGLNRIRALQPASDDDESIGAGRYGVLPTPLAFDDFVTLVARVIGNPSTRSVAAHAEVKSKLVSKVAIACGSGGEFLAFATRRGCDALVTGEATFHTCLEARATGIGLVLTGHFHSERFAMVKLAETLAREFADISVFASEQDVDPLKS
jgi:dinuclear metal center YbgI/SA1388 family protein